jgi:hypothetical protein
MKKLGIIGGVFGLVVGLYFGYDTFLAPHRDVQSVATDFSLQASDIVAEYLTDATLANDKYLDEEGESKVLKIKGTVRSITVDFNDQKVILLQSETDKAGVSCTFTAATNADASKVEVGSSVSIKGVIRSGAAYDEDLEMYEHVIMEKCKLIGH